MQLAGFMQQISTLIDKHFENIGMLWSFHEFIRFKILYNMLIITSTRR